MTFEDQLNALVYFHLQEHKSVRHLVQDLVENEFTKQMKRVRQLRPTILNEFMNSQNQDQGNPKENDVIKDQKNLKQAKT